MSLLTACQEVAEDIGITKPAAIIGSTDETAKRLLNFANRSAQWFLRRHEWVEMTKEYPFVVSVNVDDYPLPSDFRKMLDGTVWNRNTYEQMRGGLSPQEWQVRKSSLLLNNFSLVRNFRIRQLNGAKILSIDPVPASNDTLVFEYLSKNFCQSAGGTHQASWVADSDLFLLPEELLILDVRWRVLRRLGMDYAEEYNEAMDAVSEYITSSRRAPTLYLTGRRAMSFTR